MRKHNNNNRNQRKNQNDGPRGLRDGTEVIHIYDKDHKGTVTGRDEAPKSYCVYVQWHGETQSSLCLTEELVVAKG